MKILYFAWLKSKTGMSEETLEPPESVRDVRALIGWLRQRSQGHEQALGNAAILRVAVNQEFASLDQAIRPGDEIAFFPPVTGG